MRTIEVVHGGHQLPCLRASQVEASAGTTKRASVVLLGGEGKIGTSLAEYLSRGGRSVLSVDRSADCDCGAEANAGADAAGWSAHFENLWNRTIAREGATDLPASLITATRVRASALNENANDPLAGLQQNLETSVIVPLAAATTIRPHLKDHPRPSIVFLSSTNARTLSHQPLGYHAANAALSHSARYLGVQWIDAVHVYCVQVGAIHTLPPVDESTDLTSHFPGVLLEDLHFTIDFLITNSVRGLVGEPIVLSAGRENLDATAVHQGRFGDLSRY